MKVVFHIDELSKWNLVLKNVSNLLDAVENKNFTIEVLANSEAVKVYSTNNQNLYTDNSLLTKLNNRGIKFVACNNALNSYNLKKEELFNFVSIVPVGVLELIIKQSEGYAYLKP